MAHSDGEEIKRGAVKSSSLHPLLKSCPRLKRRHILRFGNHALPGLWVAHSSCFFVFSFKGSKVWKGNLITSGDSLLNYVKDGVTARVAFVFEISALTETMLMSSDLVAPFLCGEYIIA